MKLSLRKKAVNKKIMENRKITEENHTFNYININSLNLIPFKDYKNTLFSLKTGEDKLVYMTTYLENNIEITDIFSNLFYHENNSQILSDIEKYFLLYILAILDSSVMKKCFPDYDVKENNIIIDKDNLFHLSKKLFQIFFSILFNVKMNEVQVTVVSLMLNFSDNSEDFVDYCLEDIRYMNKLFELTYINNDKVISEVGCIFNNIIINKSCDDKKLEEILKNIPLIQRCKELISINNFNNTLKGDYLDLLDTIVDEINEDDYFYYFIDFINIFSNILSSTPKNEEIFNLILHICNKLVYDEKISEEVMKTGLGFIFFNSLSTQNLERENLILLLQIFTNLFCVDEIIKYFINYNNSQIIPIFIRIINAYLHSANEKDLNILKEVLNCLSNFASGPDYTQTIISKSDLPKLVIQIMKIRQDNKIYFAGIQFFQSILDNCNIETFTTISELHPFKLYAKGLEKTGIYENIILCLKCLENLTIKNQQVYNTIENLKNEFYIYGIKRKMDELTFHKVEEISTLAIRVLNYFDDKMKTD